MRFRAIDSGPSSKNSTRLGKDNIGRAGGQSRTDLRSQSLGFRLLNAAVGQHEIAFADMKRFVPGSVDGRAEKPAPFRIESTISTDHVAITQHDGLRNFFSGAD